MDETRKLYEEYDILSMTGSAGEAAARLGQLPVHEKYIGKDLFLERMPFAELYLRTIWDDPDRCQEKKDILTREEAGDSRFEEMRFLLPAIARLMEPYFQGDEFLSASAPSAAAPEQAASLQQALRLCLLEKMILEKQAQQQNSEKAQALLQDASDELEAARRSYETAVSNRRNLY